MRNKNALLLIWCVIFISGCGFTASNYSASVHNIEQLRTKLPTGASINVSKFESPAGPIELSCRLNPMTPPNNLTYEDYIREALVNELRLAGAYSEKSDTELKVMVDEIDASASMLGGNWTLRLNFAADGTPSFPVEFVQEFNAPYDGGIACEREGNNLVPAVQGLIGRLFSDDRFLEILQKSVSSKT